MSPLVESFLQELRAATTRSADGDTIFAHTLSLRRQLLESATAQRRLTEQALRAHLDGVRSYQQQLDRHARQDDDLERAISLFVRRLKLQ
jgi:hypothetical protein